VRVVLPNGEQYGIMSTAEALEKAKMVGMDLVEVTAKSDPPVARIIDYGKYKYEQAKLKKNNPKTKVSIKEIKFRVRTEENDYNMKLANAEKFLIKGHKLKMALQFRGRENAHRELGFEVLKKVAADLETMAHVDQAPKLAGRNLSMMLSPLPADKRVPKFWKEGMELNEDAVNEPDDEDGIEDEE